MSLAEQYEDQEQYDKAYEEFHTKYPDYSESAFRKVFYFMIAEGEDMARDADMAFKVERLVYEEFYDDIIELGKKHYHRNVKASSLIVEKAYKKALSKFKEEYPTYEDYDVVFRNVFYFILAEGADMTKKAPC